jgi:beta-glucanase (GH16 family)
MKEIYTKVILFIFCLGTVSAQEMPLDFSDSNDTFIPFGGSSFSIALDPTDSSNEVGQFSNNGTLWEGFFIDLSQPVSVRDIQELTLSFYQADASSHDILLKLENGTGPDVEVLVNTSGTGWANDLIFDFANATISGTNNTVSATGNYSRLTIFIDPGVEASGTYYIDDIAGGSEAVDPNELDVIYTDLVWADEFDTDGAVNPNNWFHQTQLPASGSWFNGEEQHYTNRIENSFVNNGFLNIVAIKESFTDQGETKQYTSARLNSKFAFTYGRVDVRARLPFGDGTWPAIWTLGKNISEDGAYWENQGFGTTPWPACGEIDIMEHGIHGLNEVSAAIHTPSSFGATVNTATQPLADVANNFHVYSVNWSPDQITFLIDGVGYYTYNPSVKNDATWPFDLDQYILLNIAMGGVAGPIDQNFSQSSMVIDYVRVYQNSGLGLEDVFESQFNIYPNPTKDLFNIKTNKVIDGVALYNNLGQVVLERDGNVRQVGVNNFDKGIYYLKIRAEQQVATKKIVIN